MPVSALRGGTIDPDVFGAIVQAVKLGFAVLLIALLFYVVSSFIR